MITPARQSLLKPPEIYALTLSVLVFGLMTILSITWKQEVDWGEVLFRNSVALGVGCLGVFYRKLQRNEGIALAFIGTGLFVGFTNNMVLLNYLFLPINRPVIDPLLTQIDADLGFHWSNFVIWLSEYPWLSHALALVYYTSAPQMFGLILYLGFTCNDLQLYRFITAGMISGIMAVVFWVLFPSFGPAAYQLLPPGIEEKASLVVTNAYGEVMLQLAKEGLSVLSFSHILGLIAFPSFHTVMAALAVWYSYRLKIFFPVLALNSMMLPAIISHGGHYLVDVFGGLVVFAVSVLIANKLLPASPQYQTAS